MNTERLPSHLPLAQRKVLAPRILYFDSVQDLKNSLAPADRKEIDFLEEHLFRLSTLATELPSPDKDPLDGFVREISKHLDLASSALVTNGNRSHVDNALAVFKGATTSLDCAACSPLKPVICDGHWHDDRIVDGRGQCIAPLKSAFDAALSLARRYYSTHSTYFSNAIPPSVEFSTSFRNSTPHDCPVPYHVGGATEFQDVAARKFSIVKLTVVPEQFDFGTYSALLYVLVHECVCHAFEGILPFPDFVERVATEPDDGFAEGWMDWVAHEILQEALHGKGPATDVVSKLQHLEEIGDAATKFHLSRVDDQHPQQSKHAIERAFGRDAAQRVLYLFERLPESRDQPWELFLRLSFDLNVLPHFHEIREQVVSLLELLLPKRGAIETLSKANPLTDSFRKYLTTNNILQLIADFLTLL